MPKTVSDVSGDGVTMPYVAVSLTLPDVGSTIQGEGNFTPVGGVSQPITGFPLTAPSPPGSGLIYWIIQVNTSTLVASVKSDVAPVVPDAGNKQIFSQTLAPTDSSLSQDTSSATIDESVGGM